MSGDYAYVFDEYVNGTPERQARYISDFRINLANLRTVVGSELAGRMEILDEAVLHSSTAHERLLRAGPARIHRATCAQEFRSYINLSEKRTCDYDFSVIDWNRCCPGKAHRPGRCRCRELGFPMALSSPHGRAQVHGAAANHSATTGACGCSGRRRCAEGGCYYRGWSHAHSAYSNSLCVGAGC